MTRDISLSRGKVAIVDECDFPIVSCYRWHYDPKGGYAATTIGGRKNKLHIKLHRFLMGCPDDREIDHINGNRLDNRRENLRLATRQQNARNCRSRRGISKYKGVTKDSGSGRWRAQIRAMGHLGTFDEEIVAAVAYDRVCRELYGEFACPNFSDQEYTELWARHGETILNPKRRKGSSRYVGVSWSNRDKVWKAQLCWKGKVIPVGTFKTEEEAARARELAKREYIAV